MHLNIAFTFGLGLFTDGHEVKWMYPTLVVYIYSLCQIYIFYTPLQMSFGHS